MFTATVYESGLWNEHDGSYPVAYEVDHAHWPTVEAAYDWLDDMGFLNHDNYMCVVEDAYGNRWETG